MEPAAGVLVVGNFTINPESMAGLKYVVEKVPSVEVVVLMLSLHPHENINLDFGEGRKVYLIPNFESDDSPDVLPCLPICKQD